MALITFNTQVKLSNGKLYRKGETADIAKELLTEAAPYTDAPVEKADVEKALKQAKVKVQEYEKLLAELTGKTNKPAQQAENKPAEHQKEDK
jgi:hypothetical protein